MRYTYMDENPNMPPAKLRRGWRVPFQFDVCRYVVLYRLLGFDVRGISEVCGISQANVRRILTIFGYGLPRGSGGFGTIIWNTRYSIKPETHKRLSLPAYILLSVDYVLEFGAEIDDALLSLRLPEPTKRPEKDGFSNWHIDDW